MCNLHACSETKRVTTWTPWLLANDTDIGRIERRFRFSCKAPVDTSLLKVGAMKLEERICHADGTCLRTGMSYKDYRLTVNNIRHVLIILFYFFSFLLLIRFWKYGRRLVGLVWMVALLTPMRWWTSTAYSHLWRRLSDFRLRRTEPHGKSL